MVAKLLGAPGGGVKLSPLAGTGVMRLTAWGSACAPGQLITPPAVAAAARVRPAAAPRMNSLRFSIVVLAILCPTPCGRRFRD